jgi:transcriptional regulator with XRE-family HTH domain
MTPQEVFLGRLRRHRERNRISLDEIADETRVKRELLEFFERNDLSAWPRGLYARAWVRAYASTIGLDPIDTVDEFCRLFPEVGDRRVHGTITEIAAIIAAPSEYRDEFSHEFDRRGAPRINILPKPWWRESLQQVVRFVTATSRLSGRRSARRATP